MAERPLNERFADLEDRMISVDALTRYGTANDLSFYIFDYAPSDELLVRRETKKLKDRNPAIVEFDLYEMMLQIIDEEGYMVESWSFYDKELKKDVWNDRYVLNNLYEFIIKYHNIKYWFYGHFHNMYKTIYNDITFIGLDMYYKHIKTVKYSLEKSIVKYGPDLYNLYDENKFTNLKEIKN